jgi:hypothetical protein
MSYSPSVASCIVSTVNSSTTNLAAGNSYTFTGVAEKTPHPDLMLNLYADQATTITIQFSQDGVNWDSSLIKKGASGFNEFTTSVKGSRYVRVIVTTASLTTTVFRLQIQYGQFRQGNASLNSVIGQDADALTVRNLNEELGISAGLFAGYSIVQKFGRNPDIDTAANEDVWAGGGFYAGFPTTGPAALEAVSSNAGDTGQLTVTYLASETATEYSTVTVTMNGTTPVPLGVSGHRVHTVLYSSGSPTTFNLGVINVRHIATPTNVFCAMPIGRSQTNVSAYTIPFGYTGRLVRLFCVILGSASANVGGSLWVRPLNGSPRLRRPFSASTGAQFEERPYGGLILTGGTDIVVRITECSVNNTDVIAGYDIILIKD